MISVILLICLLQRDDKDIHQTLPTCATNFTYLSLFDLALDSQNGNQTPFATPQEIRKITKANSSNNGEFVKQYELDQLRSRQ